MKLAQTTAAARLRRSRGMSAPAQHFEALEPRVVLSVISAGVGVSFDGTTLTPYSVEATLADNGAFAASVRNATDTGAGPAGAGDIQSLGFMADGRMVPGFVPSASPYQTMSGTRFVNGSSYPVGWFSGVDAGYTRGNFWLATQGPVNFALADMAGHWDSRSLVVIPDMDLVAAGWGTLDITGTSIARYQYLAGHTSNDTVTVTSTQPGGAFRLSDGEYGWASSTKRTGLVADLDFSDGQASITLVFQRANRSRAQVAGLYRVGSIATGAFAQLRSGRDAVVFDVALDLRTDGTYSQYDLAEYDAGSRTPGATGSWDDTNGSLTLIENGTGRFWSYDIASDGVTLVPYSTAPIAGGNADLLFGAAVRVVSATAPVFSVARNDAGAPTPLYTLQNDGSWRAVDLESKPGSPAITGKVVTWTDPKDALVYAAAEAGSSLVLYRRDSNGSWSCRNLAVLIPGAAPIAGNLDVMVDPTGTVHLVGLDSAGDLVHYFQTGAATAWGEFDWGFVNIAAADLRAHGDAMPAFVGPTVSYATSWGGLNVAGLDHAGNIWSVWWAPGVTRWSTANLTSAYGADPVAGGLTVYLTSWGGINIAALDSTGQIQVTWWVPEFAGKWEHSNLTSSLNGPRFTVDSVSSYVSSWGGLNIAGADRTTGEIMVYWWAPARVAEGWAVTAFASALPPGAGLPSHDLRGLAGPDSSLNVFGASDSGAFLRYYWYPSFGGAWQWQEVSTIAAPD